MNEPRKVAIITGAERGIGAGLAAEFRRAGYRGRVRSEPWSRALAGHVQPTRGNHGREPGTRRAGSDACPNQRSGYGYHSYGDPWKEQRYAGD
jgi:NAD(P)-dependent dehydrogenase (short-subunit alcohol dehydrogenase family)